MWILPTLAHPDAVGGGGHSIGAPESHKMARRDRGTPCHNGGTVCHEFCNHLKNKKNSTVSNFAPKTAEKCFIYKALEETGSLLRQVCKIFPRGGSNAMRQRSSAPLVDGCECDRRLPILMGLGLTLTAVMAARCPSSAEAWQSGSSFSKADSRSVPGEGSSFLQASVAGDGSSFAKASATSDFELRPTSPSRPGTAFTMPADRDELVRLRALISHAESRSLGYDDDHGSGGSAQIPPPKRPPDMPPGYVDRRDIRLGTEFSWAAACQKPRLVRKAAQATVCATISGCCPITLT